MYTLTCTDHATGKTNTYVYSDEELGWCFRAKGAALLRMGGTLRDSYADWKVVAC